MITEHILIKEILALIWIEGHGVIGRYRLKHAINLTEGVTRGLLKRLSNLELIKTEGNGYAITPKGREELKNKLKEFSIVDIKEFDVGSLKSSKESIIIHLKGLAPNVSKGIEQRDAAIRVGAEGATTIIYKKNALFIPFNGQTLERLPEGISKKFKEYLSLRDNDVVVIGFAEEKARALEGALAASILTSKDSPQRIGFKEKESIKQPEEPEIAQLSVEQIKEIEELEKKHKIRLVGYK